MNDEPIRQHKIAVHAASMADASAPEWEHFIDLLGGDAAARLLAAIESRRAQIEHHVRTREAS